MSSRQRALLAIYLESPNVTVPLPGLPSHDLQNALNSRKYTPGNNDVLEFIGDRVVNLACALMASKINHSPAQQTLFARRLSNNDTLGRIAYQLRLPQHARARLDPSDRSAAEDWSRRQSGSPPKFFADLFESYTGALFLRHGWHCTHAWLRKVYAPILTVASCDALSTTQMAPPRWSAADPQPWSQHTQWAFEDFIEERGAEMKEITKVVISALPRSAVSIQREEVGMQLLKLWICELVLGIYPELRGAMDRGAHFLSSINNAIMSEDTLGHLALLLALSSYLPPSDPDFLVAYPTSGSGDKPIENIDRAKPKLANVLKALTGAFYFRHPTRARKWGHKWLSPLVFWTIEVLLRLGNRQVYRPVIDHSPKITLKEEKETAKTGRTEVAIDALLTFGDLSIKPEAKGKPTIPLLATEIPSKAKLKSKKLTIKINAPWLFDNAEVRTNEAELDLDLDLDPFKLLDEGRAFPAFEIMIKNGDENDVDADKDLSRSLEVMATKLNAKNATGLDVQHTDCAGDSDGSEDMQFSTSSSGTESDMEFSEKSDSEPEDHEIVGESKKDEEEVLTLALGRLEIASKSNTSREEAEGYVFPGNPLEPPHSDNDEKPKKRELVDAATTTGELCTEELKKMPELSSSSKEHSNNSDMEFSSDEEGEDNKNPGSNEQSASDITQAGALEDASVVSSDPCSLKSVMKASIEPTNTAEVSNSTTTTTSTATPSLPLGPLDANAGSEPVVKFRSRVKHQPQASWGKREMFAV